jgi:hypothetical protein
MGSKERVVVDSTWLQEERGVLESGEGAYSMVVVVAGLKSDAKMLKIMVIVRYQYEGQF